MSRSCLLYYITDRSAFPGDDRTRRRRLLDKITEAATAGVDYIQLREKDLPTRDLESLAQEAMSIIRQKQELATDHYPLTTALLINSRTDVALAVEANGVHLPAHDVSPQDVKTAWRGTCSSGRVARELSPQDPLITVSCHSPQEVLQAAEKPSNPSPFRPCLRKKRRPRSHARWP